MDFEVNFGKDAGRNSGYGIVMDSIFFEDELDVCTALVNLPLLLVEVQQGHNP